MHTMCIMFSTGLSETSSGKVSPLLGERVLDESDLTSLCHQLMKHSTKWKEIGTYLGFKFGELNNIQSHPFLLMTAPNSWMSEMLAQWLQWAPGDGRGSSEFATLKNLKSALRNAGLGVIAEELRVDQFDKETGEYYTCIIHVKLYHIIIIKLNKPIHNAKSVLGRVCNNIHKVLPHVVHELRH